MQQQLPLSRRGDPLTSFLAGESVRPGQRELKDLIRAACERLGPSCVEEIACEVERWRAERGYEPRWTHGGIVSACAPTKSGLFVDGHKINSRGRLVQLLVTEPAEAQRIPITEDYL